MKLKSIVQALAMAGMAVGLALPAQSQQRIEITGSSIKRIADEGALPLQIFSRQEIERTGVQSAEQLIAHLNINGNGLDNLAANADVVTGQSRGNNGSTSANLRGQGSNATLILLNGRRVATHGLNGGVVDLNQIPFSAIERVEVLKDGASSIYGTDAVGGVINFILRKNFTGLQLAGTIDKTEAGGGDIYRASVVGGFGDIEKNGYNILATLSVNDFKRLDGKDRDFVTSFAADRGLSADTRGAPFATLFAVNQTSRGVLTRPGQTATGTGPLFQGVTLNGINTLDLPGAAGCASQPNMAPYDEKIWAAGAGAQFGCAWDTGKAAVIQQPVKNTNLVVRGTFKLGGEHLLTTEAVLGRSESAKTFSENQITSATGTATTTLPNLTTAPSPFRNLAYPSTGAGYNRVFNALVAAFPELEANRGNPMPFRWRCMACGPRQIETESDTTRYLIGLEGPLPFLKDWDYRAGISTASSQSKSTLGSGYHNWMGFANLINTGVLNPFLLNGETQTPQAMAALEAISARGTQLYGGKFTMSQSDVTVSGPLFKLPGGDAQMALGVDLRTEKYRFDGNLTVNTNDINTWIFNAPFDNINALGGVKRDVKAVFGELLLPVIKGLELNLSARNDNYTGFGGTTNPKVTIRFTPAPEILFRGSYSTAFRVPTFNQLFNGITDSPYTGAGVVDPQRCPSLTVNSATGNPCNAITFNTLFGGVPNLGPEEAKLYSAGTVWQPTPKFVASLDWWEIRREGTIQALSVAGANGIIAQHAIFGDRILRNASGNIVFVDTSWINSGGTLTRGLDINLRGTTDMWGVRMNAGFDLSYLLEKKSRLVPTAAFGASEVGVFTRSGDLGIRWKHTAYVTATQGPWSGTLTQVYRGKYAGFVPPGVANGTILPSAWDPIVKPYTLHHLTVSYTGIKGLKLTAGVKNLFDKDPPFANSYDTNTGSGSSWEPRVADPRGRSFLLSAEYNFF